jgi:hypothetical protein
VERLTKVPFTALASPVGGLAVETTDGITSNWCTHPGSLRQQKAVFSSILFHQDAMFAPVCSVYKLVDQTADVV